MKKKADMTIQMLVIIVMALVVAAVLIAIFVGKAKIFGRTIGETCEEKGGKCLAQGETSCPSDLPLKSVTNCNKGTPNCKEDNTCTCCYPLK